MTCLAARRRSTKLEVGLGVFLGCLAMTGTAEGTSAQLGPIRGYSRTVTTVSESSPFGSEGVALFQRLRLMSTATLGALALEVAYEHGLEVTEAVGTTAAIPGSTTSPASTGWLQLSGTLAENESVRWTNRLDRLSLSYGDGSWQTTVGRQPISWATTLFLTPADPFAPFDPSDPFREYRVGVDAVRVRYYPGALSEFDLVFRPVDTNSETTITALLRGRSSFASTEVSGWAGTIHDDFGAGVGASRSVGGFEVRAEASVREDPLGGGLSIRTAAGIDRRVSIAARDLYLVFEYAHDGFGAPDAAGLATVIASRPFSQGELQVVGRDELAVSASLQLHPLWTVNLVTLTNLRDGSALVAPAASYAVGADVKLRAGVFVPVGDGGAGPEGLGSEYGVTPLTGYLSMAWFF